MPYKNPVKGRENKAKYREDLNKNAINSIIAGEILDKNKWDVWCKQIKNSNSKHPYSYEFTNNIMFEMMIQGCFYCGDIATTIDRINSTLDHLPNNCVGCCKGCNNSKGVADPSTFIRKSYYQAREEYVDDITDIWFVNKTKPSMTDYKKRAGKKGVSFELMKEDFEELIRGDCEYCHRTPTTWFGVDRMVPSKGYVIDNVVSCCFDCNLDKHNECVETMKARNNKIVVRVDTGDLVIVNDEKVILHNGMQKTSKKVCTYGNVYDNQSKASRALGKNIAYVGKCIRYGRYPNDIFEITDDFYEEYKDCCEITRSMFIAFDHFYTNM
jgi:5-methylcytosine-specific restriction endonuclease McrA